MRRFVGHLWCAVFPALVYAAPTILSYQQLLDSWNAAGHSMSQSFETQYNIYDLLQEFRRLFPGQFDYSDLRLGDRFFYVNSAQSTVAYTFPNYYVPVRFYASRGTNDNPAPMLYLDASTLTSNAWISSIVPYSKIHVPSSSEFPPVWDLVRNALQVGQNGHLPIALAVLTYPGFTDWALRNINFRANIYIPSNQRDLRINCDCVTWANVSRYWTPTVVSELGAGDYLTQLQGVAPRVTFSFRPISISDAVYLAPHYPGPFWHQNLNGIQDDGLPEYVLDPIDAIEIADEFADGGPFGSPSFHYCIMIQSDDSWNPAFNFKFRMKATVHSEE